MDAGPDIRPFLGAAGQSPPMQDPDGGVSRREKLAAIADVARFRPVATVGIVLLSVAAALLEGVGLSFIIPIVEQVQAGGPPSDPGGILGGFVAAYRVLGLPFTLASLVVGVSAVMAVRYTASFAAEWLRASLRTRYVRHLQVTAFERAVDARVAYFDRAGSDDILNAIVTQAEYAGRVIDKLVRLLMHGLIAGVYLGIALYLAPLLTLAAVALLGGIVFVFRHLVESGYGLGGQVADANERIQGVAQAGTQGIRDVKAFGLAGELAAQFRAAADRYMRSTIAIQRNEAAINQFYQLAAAVAVFGLIYATIAVADLSLAALGVFLFAMFRLAPQVSTMGNLAYGLDGDLPHLVRTRAFVAELQRQAEPAVDDPEPVPSPVPSIRFDDVAFAYETADGRALEGVDLRASRGEFVALVGPSGAGKSTVAALVARLYDPTAGEIRVDGTPLERFAVDEWRREVALVRQHPYLFDRSLRDNLTVGARDATDAELARACEIARIDEFLEELPSGLDTQIGDDGVRLSGGQRQRVAIARALLTDASVLVLDEATSDLDTTLEAEVHRGIEAGTDRRTVIAIAHRLSTVADADRIYVLDDGRVLESGSHEELVAREGLYTSLRDEQALQ